MLPNQTPKSESAARPISRETRIVLGLIAATLFLTCLPYLLGYFITPPGMTFIGTAYNIDDYCNYLSWLRQAADGHLFLRNLFTTEPQAGLQCNLLFSLLGVLVRVPHLSPQAALQVARIAGGAGLLVLVYRFYRHCLPDNPAARLTAFGFACLGSGLGWIAWPHWHDKNLPGSPVDAWQPEAFTFLSLYTSALFTVSTLLIVGLLYALLLGEQTKKWRYPIIAGLCGLILGNIHSYDILHVSAAWGLFLIVWTIRCRGRGVALTWARSLLALALTLPSVLYEYYVFRADPIFHKRAEVPTLTPAFWYYVWGYGLIFLLAVIGLACLRRFPRAKPSLPAPPESEGVGNLIVPIFLVCWAAAGFAVSYLPVAFQRKMLMGEDIPLCLLAGWGAAWLTRRLGPRPRALALAALVVITFPSNALFLLRDMSHLVQNRSETALSPYLSGTLTDVFGWLRADTPPSAAVLGLPTLCAYVPGETGRAVWAGHWGETPSYAEKVSAFSRFADAQTSDTERRWFLADSRCQYLFYPNDVSALSFTSKAGVAHVYADFVSHPPPYLRPEYANKEYTIFQILPEKR